MKAVRGLLYPSLVLALFAAAPSAQDKPAQEKPPVFRTSVDVIRLDVSVLDRNRRPIRDLTQGDFKILVDGVEQPIVAFSPVVLPARPAPSAGWVADVAPDVASNNLPAEPRLFVIVMDDAQTPTDPWMVKTGKEIAAAIVNGMGPADMASIVFTLNGRHAQDFTSDRARLLRAIDTFSTQGGLPLAGRIVQDTLRDLMRAMRRREGAGRAALMWISTGGLPVGRQWMDPDEGGLAENAFGPITAFSEIANEARVTMMPVYGFSIAGLMAPSPPDRSRFASMFPKFTDQSARAGNEALRTIADFSGGRAVVDTNAPATAVPAILEETGAYYVLGYRATYPAGDKKYRRLRVTVNHPDAAVYPDNKVIVPLPDKTKAERAAAAAPLHAAMADVLPRRDLPLRVHVAPFAAPSSSRTPSAVAVTLGIHQRVPNGARSETVDVLSRVFTPDGYPVTGSKHTATVRLNGTGTQGTYEILSQLDLKPGRYLLRTSAQTKSSATLGSVYTDITVPDFRKAPLSLSGVVISATPAAHSAPAGALASLIPVVPTTEREFTKTQQVSAFLRVYQGGSHAVLPAGMRVSITDAAGNEVATAARTIAAPQFAQRAADYTYALPVASLGPGSYLVTFSATTDAVPPVVAQVRFSVR